MTTLIITRGLPASGKTTWAKTWVAEDLDNRARVNRDDLRLLLHDGPTYTYPQEAAVTAAEHAAVRALLESGRDVVVDNMNLRARYVNQYSEIARNAGAEVEVKDFVVPLQTAVDRDRSRYLMRGHRSVGEQFIRDTAKRYHIPEDGTLPPVPKEREISRHWAPVKRDYYLPRAFLVDIDGTVALHNGRDPHDYDKLGGDVPNDDVIETIRALRSQGYELVFLSGRPDSHYDETRKWLAWEIGGYFEGPFMRRAGDTREDSIVKAELFNDHVRDKWDVVGVFDDRNRVVRMWRDLGLTAFQVAEGAF